MWFVFFNFADVSLTPDLSLLIVLILFVLLVFLLNAIIFKPITKVIDERERLTTGAVLEAKHALRDYDLRLQDYQEKIRGARADSYRMLEAQRATALTERSRILAEVKTEVTGKIDAEKREIRKAAHQAREKLETDAREIAQSISRNILKRPLGGALQLMIYAFLFTQMKAATFLFAFSWAEAINPLIPRTVNLLIFLAVLFFILRKPLTQAMQDRREGIKAELKRAKAEKEEAENKLKEIEARLSRLDEEVAGIKATAEQEAKAEYERLLKQADEDAQRIKMMAQREIEGASKAAHLELKEFAAAKSVELAENMIRKEIRPEDDARLIKEFAKELEGVK